MRSKDKVYKMDLPCIHEGCPNKNSGKKQMCSTHYKRYLKDTKPGYAEHVKRIEKQRLKNKSDTERLAASRKYRQKKAVQPLATIPRDIKDCVKIVKPLDEILYTSGMSRISSQTTNPLTGEQVKCDWRTYMNNLVEDEKIEAWEYDPIQDQVTVFISKSLELENALSEET